MAPGVVLARVVVEVFLPRRPTCSPLIACPAAWVLDRILLTSVLTQLPAAATICGDIVTDCGIEASAALLGGLGIMVGGARVVVAGVVLLSSLAVVEPLGASTGPQVPGSPAQVPVEAGDSEPEPVEVVPGVPVVLPPGREEIAPSPDDGPIVSPADVGLKRDARVVAVSELVDVVVDGRARVGTSPVIVEFVSVAPAAISVENRSSSTESDDATVAESASGTSTTSVEEVTETTLATPINVGGGSSIDDSVSAGGDATVDEFDVAAASTSSTTVPVESTVDELVAGSPSGDVDVSQPGRVRVDVVGEEMAASAGLEKVAFTVEPVDGAFARGDRARVTIDYSGFRDGVCQEFRGLVVI